MTTIIGSRATTPADYRKLVKAVLEEDPTLVEFWERNAIKDNATEHEKNLAKYGREYTG